MKRKQIYILATCLVLAVCVFFAQYGWMQARAEETLGTCWILCKPGSRVNVRRTPDLDGQVVGFLEVGDDFRTDGVSSNGWIRCYGIGEFGEGWVYCGYVAEEQPVEVNETYVCVAKSQVACRKWMGGPQTENPWLRNGRDVLVYFIAGDWAITARGYIRAEWLEVDPQ